MAFENRYRPLVARRALKQLRENPEIAQEIPIMPTHSAFHLDKKTLSVTRLKSR